MALTLKKQGTESIIYWQGEPVKTMDGKRNLADNDHEIMQYLFECLKGIQGLQPVQGLITHPLANEYRIFSLMKEYREIAEEEKAEMLMHMLQCTPVFRSNADPQIKMEQYAFYGSLLEWLNTKQLSMPDLPYLMSDSPEDFQQQADDFAADGTDIKVDNAIIEAFMELYSSFTERQRAALFYLAFAFEEPVFAFLWIADLCSHTEIAEGTMAANQYLPGMDDLSKEEFDQVVKNRERIAVAAKIFGG